MPARGAVCVLGRNGAGKTTLLKTLAGDLGSDVGLDRSSTAERVDQTPMEQRARAGIGYVPQEHAVFAGLTVRENLQLGAIRQRDRSGIDEVLAVFPKLGSASAKPAGTLSGGERKMLAIGRAMLGRPRAADARRADRGRVDRRHRGDRRAAAAVSPRRWR